MQRPQARAVGAEAGFSLLEVLIAAVLMLVIAVGVLPLFTRAMTASLSGNDSSQASNFGRSRLECMRVSLWLRTHSHAIRTIHALSPSLAAVVFSAMTTECRCSTLHGRAELARR